MSPVGDCPWQLLVTNSSLVPGLTFLDTVDWMTARTSGRQEHVPFILKASLPEQVVKEH